METYKREISTEEKNAILLTLCEEQIGYKKTHDFLEKVLKDYDPVEYAVKKARNDIEKR